MSDDSKSFIDMRLNDGRQIWCRQYFVSETYDAFQVRTPSEESNEMMLDLLKLTAGSIFTDDWPFHIIPCQRNKGQIDYPPVRISALFTSSPIKDEMHLSSLVLIWFQNEQELLMNQPLLSSIQSVDWNSLALDYET